MVYIFQVIEPFEAQRGGLFVAPLAQTKKSSHHCTPDLGKRRGMEKRDLRAWFPCAVGETEVEVPEVAALVTSLTVWVNPVLVVPKVVAKVVLWELSEVVTTAVASSMVSVSVSRAVEMVAFEKEKTLCLPW